MCWLVAAPTCQLPSAGAAGIDASSGGAGAAAGEEAEASAPASASASASASVSAPRGGAGGDGGGGSGGADQDELVAWLQRLHAERGHSAPPRRLAPRRWVKVTEGPCHLQEAREPATVDLSALGQHTRTLGAVTATAAFCQARRGTAMVRGIQHEKRVVRAC